MCSVLKLTGGREAIDFLESTWSTVGKSPLCLLLDSFMDMSCAN
jgi:hypothetical protein